MYQWALITSVLLLIFLQINTLTLISHLSTPSTIAVIIAVVSILASFGKQEDGFNEDTSLSLPGNNGDFLSIYGAFSSFVFAYQGQSMFCEM